MEISREFLGVWIPREVWLDERLSMIDKGILTEITSLDNENHCSAGNEYFAKFCQCSEVTVSRSIAKLEKLGYITKISFDGRVRILQSNIKGRVVKKINETYQNDKAELSKRQANNIYNNKSNNKNIYKEKYKKEKFVPNDRNFIENPKDMFWDPIRDGDSDEVF